MAEPSTNLVDLYREVLLNHYHHPRNRREIAGATRTGTATNPVCGDRVVLSLDLRDGTVHDAAFQGLGCAISTASASMLTESVRGLDAPNATALSVGVRAMFKEGAEPPTASDLDALAGVASAGRTACALLPWNVLDELLLKIDVRENET